MSFLGDFHVHSCHSMATAGNMNLESMYIAAQLKGITVIGTGDFTHPVWFTELQEKLVFHENGLFSLHPDISKKCDEVVPLSCRSQVWYMLTTEISNIYKKNEKTRKNHNLIFVPDFESASRIGLKLSAIGNVKSDGRPILGLDVANLLEIVLETSDRGFFVPAHIWTPWFSLLGSKSGFDSVRECFGDLISHVYAVETGLSSDPSMNWTLSGLDRFTLISNSDAHSPGNLGREANIFDTTIDYDAIINAIKTGDHFLGTLEFYPEMGKYHNDGHRKCGIMFNPKQTRIHGNTCPKCRKPLTLGVANRVNELSDRTPGYRPEHTHSFAKMIPLKDILSKIYGAGPYTKKVTKSYQELLEKLGPELQILHHVGIEKIAEEGGLALSEFISRMRENNIKITPGFDGKFGHVKI